MRTYLLQRILQAIPILIGISLISFMIIQLPPGDYLTTYVNNLRSQGDTISDEEVKALEQQYGLDSPMYMQYWKWISNFVVLSVLELILAAAAASFIYIAIAALVPILHSRTDLRSSLIQLMSIGAGIGLSLLLHEWL